MSLRILVLNERDPKNPLAGGAEVHLFEIFSRMVSRGHQVTLLAASFAHCQSQETVDGVRVRRLANRYLYYAMVPWAARREAQEGYDIVIDTLNKLPFLSPWFVRQPCMAIVHHLFGTTAFSQVSPLLASVTWLAEKLIPYAYRRVPMLAISPSTKTDLINRGLRGDRVAVVPPGIDRGIYRVGDPLRSRPPMLVWVGRLEPYKRLDTFLEALVLVHQRVPEFDVVVVGEGSARAKLESRVDDLGLSRRVKFNGFVSEARKIEILQAATLLVQTSEKEGWGMTVIEANACATVAVATRVDGLRDAVQDGVSGLLVPYNDPSALAEAISKVLLDDSLRDRLMAGGLEWADRFSWERVVDDVEALIGEAISPTSALPRMSASPF